MTNNIDDFQSKKAFGIQYTNAIELRKLAGIHIDQFRKFSDQSLDLGSYITVIAGKNGTMKSSLMGLCIHIFESTEEDIYKNTLNTKLSDVFKLSLEKDVKKYSYDIKVIDVDDHKIKQPARIYPGTENNGVKTRHRVTLSTSNQKGDTRFKLPVSYLNLKRLFPQVLMKKIEDIEEPIELPAKDLKFVSDFFERTLFRTDFNNPIPFTSSLNGSKFNKNSYGPSKDSVYDADSISSGEDNLGIIASQLLSLHNIFLKNKSASGNKNRLTGILAIDEFEATLHASTTFALFDYLYNWAKLNNIQIILTTHSTVLLEYIYKEHSKELGTELINVNVIKSLYNRDSLLIQKNPPFSEIQEEITLKKIKPAPLSKINVILEDKMAKLALSRLVQKKYLDCLHMDYNVNDQDSDGTDFVILSKLAKNYPALLTKYHAFVILDGETDLKELKLADTKNCIQFPSIFRDEDNKGFPFEKEIVHFALEQPENSKLFDKTHLGYSREALISKTTRLSIPTSLVDARDNKIVNYKNFYQKNSKDFWKIVTFYKKSNQNIITSFNLSIENLIKCAYEDLGVHYTF